jgi:O-antigen/teichoic acid export membrane protein
LSHKEILRSSSIVGGAAIVNIAVGLVKTKIVSLILGPAGLGVIILLQTVMQTAASVASLGLGQAGTRQVAEADGRGDAAGVALVRRSLLVATTLLGLVSAVVVWLAGYRLAQWFALGPEAASQMRWLAIGTALTIATQAQTALLMGFRRIGDLARVSTLSVLVAAVVGVTAVWWWGRGGIVAFVLSQVVATFVFGHLYVTRLERPPHVPIAAAAVRHQLTTMLLFGGALTVAAVGVNVGQLFARALIQQRLGAGAVGLFQASWLVSITYIGFVLQAMGADFYPRIVAAAKEPQRLARLVNDQIEVAVLLAAPVLLGMLGIAPWLMRLLYSRAFDPAVQVLQWQVLGDVLKVASWPLGYLLLAVNASRAYMAVEISAILVLLAALWLLLPTLGLEASGASVLAMYVFYLGTVYAVAVRRTGFRPARVNVVLLGSLFAACAVVFMLARVAPLAGATLGIVLAGGAAGMCFWRLRDSLPGPLERVAERLARR